MLTLAKLMYVLNVLNCAVGVTLDRSSSSEHAPAQRIALQLHSMLFTKTVSAWSLLVLGMVADAISPRCAIVLQYSLLANPER